MSVSTARGTVVRLQKEIADLRVKDAAEAKKEASLTEKMVKASNAVRTSKTTSTITSKLTEASRASGDIASVQKKRADLAKSLAAKVAELTRAQTALDKADEADRKKIAADLKKADDARARQLKLLESELAAQRRAAYAAPVAVAVDVAGTRHPRVTRTSPITDQTIQGRLARFDGVAFEVVRGRPEHAASGRDIGFR